MPLPKTFSHKFYKQNFLFDVTSTILQVKKSKNIIKCFPVLVLNLSGWLLLYLKSKPGTNKSQSKVKRNSATRSRANPVIIHCEDKQLVPLPQTRKVSNCCKLKKNNTFCIPAFYLIIYIKNYNIFVHYQADFVV